MSFLSLARNIIIRIGFPQNIFKTPSCGTHRKVFEVVPNNKIINFTSSAWFCNIIKIGMKWRGHTKKE